MKTLLVLSVWLLIILTLVRIDRDVAARSDEDSASALERLRVCEETLAKLRGLYVEGWKP